MTKARSELVDLEVTRYYHCISRCVRQAFLMKQGPEDRKQWLEDRIELLAANFAISVCSFGILDNHLHVAVRIDPDRVVDWSDEQVVRRWLNIYRPATLHTQNAKTLQAFVDQILRDDQLVAEYRVRLSDLGWFMKSLKEPLARLANKSDGVRGTFWESRYQSIAILDDEALLTVCAYIDLNPVAAGIADTPEESPHTSVRQRVEHVKSKGKLKQLQAAAAGSVAGSRAAGDIEQDHWLCPVEDRRGQASGAPNGQAVREGMLAGFSLGSYLMLVDHTSRLCRDGKAHVGSKVASIFERLGTTAQVWEQRLKKLFDRPRLLGNYFATDPRRLNQIAAQRGAHHLNNLVTVPRGSG